MPTHDFAPLSGRVETFELDAPDLLANRLGDPTRRSVAVYLPPDYGRSSTAYPLLVDLAAFTGSGLKRLSWSAFGCSIPQRIERLIERGALGPVVVAFPDCFTSLGGNQYVDSPVLGRWETWLLEALLPALEARYRIRPGPSHRAVYGKSSGGYGALRQALLHGDRWRAVACHSGDIGFDNLVRRDFPATLDRIARSPGGDVASFLAEVVASAKLRGSDFHVLMVLASCASYDPAPELPTGIRLPVDPHTCELDPASWARWLEHDPLHMVDRPTCRDSLMKLGGLFLDCGRRDQYFLHYGARAFVRKLEAAAVPHRYEEFDDDHSSIDYRLDVSLPWLYRILVGQTP